MARDPPYDSTALPVPSRADGLRRRAARAGIAVSFWTAVVLPLLAVALLATGIERPAEAAALLVLVGADGTALLVGRSYAREDGRPG